MKKIKAFLFGGLTILTIASCSKNDSPVTPAPVPGITKKLLTSSINGNISYEYNPDGRPKQFIWERPWTTYRYEFAYEPGKVTVTSFEHATNNIIDKEVLTLNEKGHMTQSNFNQYDVNGNPFGLTTVNYTYNAKGLLETATGPTSFTAKYYYDEEGNNTKYEYYDGAGQLIDVWFYSYNVKSDLYPAHSFLNSSWEGYFLPARSKKLVSGAKNINVINNSVIWDELISYELDAEGFVKKGIVDNLDPAKTDWSWTQSWDK